MPHPCSYICALNTNLIPWIKDAYGRVYLHKSEQIKELSNAAAIAKDEASP